MVGTEEYLAPETLNDSEVSYVSDLWSVGVIMYQMIMGETPFRGKTPLETY
jgi:serine/threonine protein kinase